MSKKCVAVVLVVLVGAVIALRHAQGQGGNATTSLQRAEQFAKERRGLEGALVSIVRAREDDADALARKRKAVALLGDIGGEKSVPMLISVVGDGFDGETIVDHNDEGNIPSTPAMSALAKLGPLAVEPLVEAIVAEKHPVLVRFKEQALGMLPCKQLVAAVLADYIGQAKEPKTRAKLISTYILVVDEKLRKARGDKVAAEKQQ